MVEKTLSPLEETFFELIRAGLHGEPARLSQVPTLKEWGNLLALAKKQSVMGLLYRGVSFLPEGFRLPEPVLFRLVAEDDQVERRGAALKSVADDLVDRLSSAGLHPILMKGPVVAAFYPEPLQREYGDIDLYLAPDEFAAAPGILLCALNLKTIREALSWRPLVWLGGLSASVYYVHNGLMEDYKIVNTITGAKIDFLSEPVFLLVIASVIPFAVLFQRSRLMK